MKKRLVLSALFAVCLLAAAIFCWPVEAQATVVDSGNCGENVNWTLDDKGTLTISGTGAMKNYNCYVAKDSPIYSESPWYKSEDVRRVIIEDGVTSIGAWSFAICANLSEVDIPESVTSIGAYAFSTCASLTRISIPKSITQIANSAFVICNGLTSVYIEDLAAWCQISFGDASSNPMNNHQAKDFYINGVLATDIAVPEGVVQIGSYAFNGFSNLEKISLPDSVTKINNTAFRNCTKLKEIVLPKNLTEIKYDAFLDCTNLSKVYFKGSQEEWTAISIGGSNDYLKNASITYNYVDCDHNWINGVVTQQPTCGETGKKTYTCSFCGNTKIDILAKLTTHTYNSGKVTKEPTCGEAGVRTYTCSVCGGTKNETIAKLTTHNYDTGTVTKAPTCSADGTKVYTCTVCGDEKTEYLTERPEHSYNSGVVTKEATCAETGEKTYTCINCGTSKVEHTPKLTTHHYMNGICLDCGGEDPQYGEPSDEEKAKNLGGIFGAIVRLLQSILQIIFFFL